MPSDAAYNMGAETHSLPKHVAAVLYGIGARLDERPELLFTLRNVDRQDLIAEAGTGLPRKRKGPAAAKVLASDDLSEIFGIEMAPLAKPQRASTAKPNSKAPTAATASKGAKPATPKPKRVRKAAGSSARAAQRRTTAERMRAYRAARRANLRKETQSTNKPRTRK